MQAKWYTCMDCAQILYNFFQGRFNSPKPLCIHEVIADGPIQTPEYYSVGKVTEFNGCYFLECIRGGDFNCLKNFGKLLVWLQLCKL